tara:strand:+ start:37865 stop:38395 length:531 start_codon:yes stop_codon:yes gene_type:complete
MSHGTKLVLIFTLVWAFAVDSKTNAQTQATETPPTSQATKPPESTESNPSTVSANREEKLAEYLSGAKFSGRFTLEGRPDAAPKAEEYTISKCEKLPAENMFRFTARIKYGDTDQEVPMDLKVLWSGQTPVITLDSFWIPGMGTFSARVLIHSDRYAGTWQHDEKGGHLFGRIIKK